MPRLTHATIRIAASVGGSAVCSRSRAPTHQRPNGAFQESFGWWPLDRKTASRQVEVMKIPRWAVGLTTAVALIVGVIGLLGFAHANAAGGTRCFIGFAHAQWPKWIGCAMAAHENLSGGLIGLAGVIFAAWLAYSGAQDQLAHVRMAAEEANRLRAQERFQEANSEVETLRLAKDYLRTFADNFPDENHPHYQSHSFIGTLSDLNRTARLYVSESAANAPRGFGRGIVTVMWRSEKLAEKIVELSDRGMLVDGTRTSMEKEVRLAVNGARKIADDIEQLMPFLRERRVILREQYLNLGGKPYVD